MHRHLRFAPWLAFAMCLAAAPLLFDSPLALTLLSQIGIAAIACLSFNLLFGQGGMLSFGHAVYTGLGAYTAMHVLNAVSAGAMALPVSLVPLAGGVGGMLCAALLGWVNTRRSGTTFAMISLGLGELVAAAAPMFPGFFGGEGGIAGNRVVGTPFLGIGFGPQIEVYGLIAAYTFVCTAAMYAFTQTPLGRLLNAVRDNAERVDFIGCSAQRVRHLAFVIAGFFAGISGGLAALNFEIVTPEVVGTARSGTLLLFTVLGGTTWFAGPMVGAVLMVLAGVLLPGLSPAGLLYVGLLFMAVVWAGPGRRALPAAAGLALAVAAAVACAGVIALVEMAYRRRFDAASAASIFGLPLDTAGVDAWVGAGLLVLTGGGLFALIRRGLAAEREAETRPGVAR